ncbi:MAG: bifunctional diaminohydroxyphosphoribosylaminopyrimidine deaminase/5-amino-6-(5-phosphoribosylamino)uracil reductase RibD [Tissierellia bacterium]|nr:bifunctional diaminohydroxyphosphoribosylaminopyrimidine deaminase/5-amino-6-(5-phosphoribosylamino)uracil reductase RibD [Tissierellia bacterium]
MERKYMKRALDLALKGQGSTKKNPLVGAVLVKEGQIIGEGYHKKYGGPHAEREALASVKEDPRGSTLYVSLEPCCHYGKTPPCTQAIIEAGISRVVVALLDPNERVGGQGIKELRQAGIQVDLGLLEEEARKINHPFFRRLRTKRPYVISKIAMSLDGKTATSGGQSQWITSQASREDGHSYRALADAILVGRGTILADDPSLTNRSGWGEDPIRVILDSQLATPLDARILHLDSKAKTLIFTQVQDPKRLEPYRDLGAQVQTVARTKGGLDLREVLRVLDQEEVGTLLVEGGSTVHGSFLEEDLIDEIVIYQAPILIGGQKARPAIGGQGLASLKEAINFGPLQVTQLGPDLKIVGRR